MLVTRQVAWASTNVAATSVVLLGCASGPHWEPDEPILAVHSHNLKVKEVVVGPFIVEGADVGPRIVAELREAGVTAGQARTDGELSPGQQQLILGGQFQAIDHDSPPNDRIAFAIVGALTLGVFGVLFPGPVPFRENIEFRGRVILVDGSGRIVQDKTFERKAFWRVYWWMGYGCEFSGGSPSFRDIPACFKERIDEASNDVIEQIVAELVQLINSPPT